MCRHAVPRLFRVRTDTKLQSMIKEHFPEEYAEREIEVAELNKEHGIKIIEDPVDLKFVVGDEMNGKGGSKWAVYVKLSKDYNDVQQKKIDQIIEKVEFLWNPNKPPVVKKAPALAERKQFKVNDEGEIEWLEIPITIHWTKESGIGDPIQLTHKLDWKKGTWRNFNVVISEKIYNKIIGKKTRLY